MTFTSIALSKGYFFLPSKMYSLAHYLYSNEQDDHYTDSEKLQILHQHINNLMKDNPSTWVKIVSIQAQAMRYGHMFDVNCMLSLVHGSEETIDFLANELGEYYKALLGDGVFVSLFGNFPATVMEMSELDMFFHQICHYISGGEYAPHLYNISVEDTYVAEQTYQMCKHKDYKMIKIATTDTIVDMFKNILSAEQSLTSYDKECVEFYCKNYEELNKTAKEAFPENIPFKETLCLVAANVDAIELKTTTDVLRLAAYMSGLDIELPAIPKKMTYGWNIGSSVDKTAYNFKKFTRAERKFILSKLDKVIYENGDGTFADMKKYLQKWVRLGEILHPGEYTKKYPNAARAFYVLRDCAKYIETYYGRLEVARKSGSAEDVIAILCERPGELVRNIDWVVRKYTADNIDTEEVKKFISNLCEAINKVGSKIATKTLYEILNYYNNRNNKFFMENRYVFAKGSRKATRLSNLEEIKESLRIKLLSTFSRILIERFAEKESLAGHTYIIDDKIKNIVLPKNMRSMNVGVGQQARGTKIPLNVKTDVMRLYCRWMDPNGQYDLDLSVSGFTEDLTFDFRISWDGNYKLRNRKGEQIAIFSGDVRHRVGNSAEYIDVDIKKMLEHGVRYLVADVRDFDGNGFEEKEAWAGVMERETWGTPGEVTWAPDTITQGFALKSKCTNIVMTIVDLKEMVMYVVDEDMEGIPVASRYDDGQADVVKRYVSLTPYFNACNLITTNVSARQGVVSIMSSFDFNLNKEKFDECVERLKISRKELIECVKLFNDSNKKYEDALVAVEKKLDECKKTHFISYDDIASDYTKIFEWMF